MAIGFVRPDLTSICDSSFNARHTGPRQGRRGRDLLPRAAHHDGLPQAGSRAPMSTILALFPKVFNVLLGFACVVSMLLNLRFGVRACRSGSYHRRFCRSRSLPFFARAGGQDQGGYRPRGIHALW
jgi:hypothetical protein